MTERKFNHEEPIAYFLTWTTYGSWLPGDQRGWQSKDDVGVQPPSRRFESTAKGRMKEGPFLLTKKDRCAVADTVKSHCQIRGWLLHAVNARSNHVHVVVSATCDPDTIVEQFKAWSSRKLKSDHSVRKRFWTEGSSKRWINHEDDLDSAIEYVLEAQDRNGLAER